MRDDENVRGRYAGKAGEEWDRLQATPITRIEYLVTSHCLARHLPPTGLILDAGCGPGRYAIDLARRGYRLVMLDLVREMLRFGREKVIESGVEARVAAPIEGDLAALPYGDGSFDAVVSLGAPLSHITDPQLRHRAISEAARVLRPGGKALVTGLGRIAAYRGVVYWGDWETFDGQLVAGDRARGLLDGSQLWYLFAPGELEGLVREAALDVIEVVGCESLATHLPMAHLEALEQDPRRWPVWRDIILESCSEPSIVGISNHLLVVAHKPL
ncbi:MAG: class I SAM-dependent methyltransferase [Anaerolineae bacterium]